MSDTSKVKPVTITKEHVGLWLDSNDSIMTWLGNEYLERNIYPSDAEAVSLLTFFSVFAMGCHELDLPEVEKVFQRRVTLYIVGLCKMGYGMKGSMWYMTRTLLFGPLKRIVGKVSNRVSYLTSETTKCKSGTRSWLSKMERDKNALARKAARRAGKKIK